VGFWNIVPILGNHVEDQLRVDDSPSPEPSDDAFEHELTAKPQPYFPVEDAGKGGKQSR
jgi:hypothetical protein